jgi:23S rRNA (cytidine1920-2'-O)/16S rRNA (cytidine1409-2'-O)-methyltransferase
MVAPDEPVELADSSERFVSRGGEKLHGALHALGIDPSGRRCLDAGASTGGFTDCLLRHGARSVVAVDVGAGQLHERLRADSRVRIYEKTNLRTAELADLGGRPFELVVADLSFISLKLVVPVLAGAFCQPGADLLVLVKPQFEAGRTTASRARGVIRDPTVWREALAGVAEAFCAVGARVGAVVPSALKGAKGNVEFFMAAWAPDATRAPLAQAETDELIRRAVAEALMEVPIGARLARMRSAEDSEG